METVQNDQFVKADKGKPTLTRVPSQIIWDIASIRDYGYSKYGAGADKWDEAEIGRYRNAAFRHLLSYLEDPGGVDAESGLPHLSHLACNVAFLCELEKRRRAENESD